MGFEIAFLLLKLGLTLHYPDGSRVHTISIGVLDSHRDRHSHTRSLR
jgi:hypothetical protein